jgi:hypothetical protein
VGEEGCRFAECLWGGWLTVVIALTLWIRYLGIVSVFSKLCTYMATHSFTGEYGVQFISPPIEAGDFLHERLKVYQDIYEKNFHT